jgi:hypothetical protein
MAKRPACDLLLLTVSAALTDVNDSIPLAVSCSNFSLPELAGGDTPDAGERLHTHIRHCDVPECQSCPSVSES